MFVVNITPPARWDIDNAYAWWRDHRSADQAEKWYDQIFKTISEE